MELVALLGENKETWGQVSGLINKGDWDKIILVKTSSDNFPSKSNIEIVEVNTSQSLLELKNEIHSKLKGKFSGLDVSVSLASGNGKEHMALLSALLTLPVGIRLAVYTKDGVEHIN